MENYEQVIRTVQRTVWIIAGLVFLVALIIYRLWRRKFMLQFNTLLTGIIRMGKGELEPIKAEPFSIGEFETMHQVIDRTSLALNHQMDTIRRMEREKWNRRTRSRRRNSSSRN